MGGTINPLEPLGGSNYDDKLWHWVGNAAEFYAPIDVFSKSEFCA